MIRIFTSLYPEKNELRAAEIRECLRRNLKLDAVDSVCLLVEGRTTLELQSPKLQWRSVSWRPRYEDFFNWANDLVQSQSDTTVVCNSDICFDESLASLADALGTNRCAALARWDIHPDGASRLFDRNDSQDVWVFRGKLRPVVADFCVGIPRCDNRILHELRTAGYEVINPAFSVRAFHLHAGSRPEYPAEIQGLYVEPPYAYLWPHNLCSLPVTLWHRLHHPDAKLGWRFDWRKLQRTMPYRVCKKLSRQLTVVSRQ